MLRPFVCAMAVFGSAGFAAADFYSDASFDIHDQSLSNLDLTGAEITNDADNLYVSIFVDDINADWGKYVMMIDVLEAPGPGSDSNPWGRNIDTSSGIDAFMGSWVDGGGGSQLFTYSEAWNSSGAADVTIVWSENRIDYSISLGALGLSIGDTFAFDIGTTGGGDNDPAIDLLSTNAVQPGWGQGSYSPMAYSYNVIPTPGVISLALVCGLGSRRRRD